MEAGLAIEAAAVSKRFGAQWAVAQLSFQLSTGKSLLLTGHNGSGKTTLLKMLATAYFPSKGSLRIFGADTAAERDALRPRIALLSHANGLYEDLSPRQNLNLLALALQPKRPPQLVAELLERVGLSARADTPIRQFSAGMKKRAAIAKLLLKNAELVLLDEPFGELDPKGILFMEQLIDELRGQGKTLVIATHLIDQGIRLTDERLHLERGQKSSEAA